MSIKEVDSTVYYMACKMLKEISELVLVKCEINLFSPCPSPQFLCFAAANVIKAHMVVNTAAHNVVATIEAGGLLLDIIKEGLDDFINLENYIELKADPKEISRDRIRTANMGREAWITRMNDTFEDSRNYAASFYKISFGDRHLTITNNA